MPWKYDSEGNVIKESPAKDTRVFDTFGEERAVRPRGVARPRLRTRAGGDRRSARQSRLPLLGPQLQSPGRAGGRITIAEVEKLVEPGEIDPDQVHVPGVFVHRVVPLTPEQVADKPIEKRTLRPTPESA